jgi:hypothetical protein
MTQTTQRLHLVFGGELTHVGGHEFADPSKLHVVGIFPDLEEARKAWSAIARATIDDAQMRYFVVELSELLEPHPK